MSLFVSVFICGFIALVKFAAQVMRVTETVTDTAVMVNVY